MKRELLDHGGSYTHTCNRISEEKELTEDNKNKELTMLRISFMGGGNVTSVTREVHTINW